MKERPIIFTENIPAILAGTKTQTRRLRGLPQTADSIEPPDAYPGEWVVWKDGDRQSTIECPWGVSGDRLWVRESLRAHDDGSWNYAADDAPVLLKKSDPRFSQMIVWAHHKDSDFCPPMFMPRCASRLTLEITDVRVDRLQEIGWRDCAAEGVPNDPEHGIGFPTWQDAYAALWDSINAKRAPWASNPWVWAITFRRVDG
jgi:hypothetical protein